MTDLTARDRAILDFEAGPLWHNQGSKETAVRERFGVSLTRYQQELLGLLEQPAALAYAPVLVKRLRRLRDQRRRLRVNASP